MIRMTKEFKKQCVAAHMNIGHSHAWGDKSNAGVNYVRGKNSAKYAKAAAKSDRTEG